MYNFENTSISLTYQDLGTKSFGSKKDFLRRVSWSQFSSELQDMFVLHVYINSGTATGHVDLGIHESCPKDEHRIEM